MLVAKERLNFELKCLQIRFENLNLLNKEHI